MNDTTLSGNGSSSTVHAESMPSLGAWPYGLDNATDMFSAFRNIVENSIYHQKDQLDQYTALAKSIAQAFSVTPSKTTESRSTPPREEKAGVPAPAALPGPNHYVGIHPMDVLAGIGELSQKIVMRPDLLLEHQQSLTQEMMSIFLGTSDLEACKSDKRFSDPAWKTNPYYRLQLQQYLASSKALHRLIDNIDLDRTTYERVRYLTSLAQDAVAPSNNFFSNPQAINRVQETGGMSVLQGIKNLLEDSVTNKGMPTVVDKSQFTLGENLAATPGSVVFTHPMFELIQYRPATEKVFEQAQLVVPPNINKYYLVDLAPGRSVVEFMVAQGFQTFVISWKNPTAENADWGMDAYIAAILEAIKVTTSISGRPNVNLHMICGASRIVAAMMGHLANEGLPLVNAFSIVCGVLLHNEEAPLGPFSSPEAIAAAKKKSEAMGVLDGEDMAFAFTWARPNDLVWNYWVNNYLLGKSPPAFDILYWNDDRTRLPARLHAEMLDIFSEKLFDKPGGIKALGRPIDLQKVTADLYVVAGATDHLAQWRNVYQSAQMFGSKMQFVLNHSGHIQSVINPPGNPKAHYFVNHDAPEQPDAWLNDAKRVEGSWWTDWATWLAQRSGNLREAPTRLGNDNYRPGITAPGNYVLEA